MHRPNLLTSNFSSFASSINNRVNSEVYFFKSPDPLGTLKEFFKYFEWIEAAGGIVRNCSSKELLFIYRNNTWDIPKGKIEDGESPNQAAIREIEEECGIGNLNIVAPLSPTYHAYYAYGKHWIKKTYWFVVETNDIRTHPQFEEGITEVKWFKNDDLNEIRSNTYVSILEVLNDFKNISLD